MFSEFLINILHNKTILIVYLDCDFFSLITAQEKVIKRIRGKMFSGDLKEEEAASGSEFSPGGQIFIGQ